MLIIFKYRQNLIVIDVFKVLFEVVVMKEVKNTSSPPQIAAPVVKVNIAAPVCVISQIEEQKRQRRER